MDDLVRGRRLLLGAGVAAGVLSLLGCAARGRPKDGALVGVSTAGAPTGRAPTDAGPRADGPIPPDFHERFTRVNHARFTSNGHAAGRFDVDVWANEAGAAAVGAERGEVPVGAVLVKEHFERADGDKPGPTMMMEKREKGFDPAHGDWRYVVVGRSGDVVGDGPMPTCSGCHDDAPHDHVFRAE